MYRQVDLKALISHIVKGDGMDRCRICMGDTSEGQVYLSDTVMTDGEKKITLADLLAMVTGVQVEEDIDLPCGICSACSEEALAAVNFRKLYLNSNMHWTAAVDALYNLEEPKEDEINYYLIYGEEITVVKNKDEKNEITNEYRVSTKGAGIKKETLKKDHLCCHCGKQFPTPFLLNAHLKTTNQRACYHCGKIVGKDKLAKHLMRKHDMDLDHCKICHRLFENKFSLDQHLLLHHGSDSHTCDFCGNGFNKERALRAHMYIHTLFHCSSCNLSYGNKKCYMHHKKLCKHVENSDESQYICDYCNVTYNKKPSLKVHILQKHLNILPYVCQTCGKRASTISHLKSHEKVHITERTVYECTCGAKMRTLLGYRLHQRIHTGEKPYECMTCGEKFLSSSRRLDHIKRRHKGCSELAHACASCPARFIRPVELKKHMKSAHKISFDNGIPIEKL